MASLYGNLSMLNKQTGLKVKLMIMSMILVCGILQSFDFVILNEIYACRGCSVWTTNLFRHYLYLIIFIVDYRALVGCRASRE